MSEEESQVEKEAGQKGCQSMVRTEIGQRHGISERYLIRKTDVGLKIDALGKCMTVMYQNVSMCV